MVRLLRPVDLSFPVFSGFGKRMLEGKEDFHNGIDFAVPIGTPVRCCIDGAAFRVGWENAVNPAQGFGLRIWQEFELEGMRYYLWYGHLSKILIKEGDRIKQGQEIALSGHTGHSTGPHLHIGVRQVNTGSFYDVDFYTEKEEKKNEKNIDDNSGTALV